jgi:hypothetical protein
LPFTFVHPKALTTFVVAAQVAGYPLTGAPGVAKVPQAAVLQMVDSALKISAHAIPLIPKVVSS